MNHPNVRSRLQRDRKAFTMVELLVVIVIISVLVTITLFALFGVQEDARESRTRAIVTKIDGLIMSKWEFNMLNGNLLIIRISGK